MSSADPGAPSVRPADVEGWLAELGLTPTERADRDGIASWDLVLDGRRRFDLRITVILDPSLAAHLLGALRAADQRHVPQVVPPAPALERRVPVRQVLGRRGRAPAARRRAPGRRRRRRRARPRASPGSSASPTGCSTSRRTGCGSAAGCPTTATGRRRNAAFLDRYAAACRSCSKHEPGSSRARLGESPARCSLVVALVAATGLLALARRGAPRSAPPTPEPDDRHRCAATTSSPTQHRVRVTLDMVLTNHLRDTTTEALLLRPRVPRRSCPARPGYKLTWSGGGHAAGRRSRRRPRPTRSSSSTSGHGIYSGKTATYRLRLRPRRRAAAPRPATSGSATSLVSFPVWAFATDSTPGSTVTGRLPGRLRGRGPGRRHPGADAPTRRAGRLPDAASSRTPLTFFAYLVGDRPGAYAEQAATADVGADPVDADRPRLAGRHGVVRRGSAAS